jgi:AcrR family transcriptional regulator
VAEAGHDRRRGRHAEGARNDARLLDAAREVFTTQGADAPIAAVAERAGLGIASIYRRYGSKDELLQRLCLIAMQQTIDAARAGLDDEDPWQGLRQYIEQCVAHRSGALAPLAGSIAVTPEMRRTAQRALILTGDLVARAHDAGVLRTDVTALDIALLIETFSRRPPAATGAAEDNIRRRLLAIAIGGLRAWSRPAADALPGQPPDPAWYQARWRKRRPSTVERPRSAAKLAAPAS